MGRVLRRSSPESVRREIGNTVEAVTSVPAALCSFLANTASFEDTVSFSIALGGDTDTIASMAGALAGAYLGLSAIPEAWRTRAEGAGSMARLASILLEHVLSETAADVEAERR